MATIRSSRSVPKVNYSWMDVQPDNVWADPDYVEEEVEEDEDDYDEPEYEHQPGEVNYTGMEFTTEDAPTIFQRIRGWDPERMCVIWRTIQKSILDDDDSDYCPSDEEDEFDLCPSDNEEEDEE